jgi:hypothetical protein
MRKAPPGTLAVVAMLLVALVFASLGGYYLLVNEKGTHAQATVTECRDHVVQTRNGSRTETKCNGFWVLGGPLGDGGRKVYGEVRGAGWSDVSETVGVRVYRGRAYTSGLTLSIGFFSLAGFFALATVGLVFLLRWAPRPRARPALPADPTGP